MDNRTVNDGGHFEASAFGKDVLIYAAGNGLLLLFGLIQGLIVPKYLSVEGYGYWQLFMLYGSYVGILHLGFPEAILVRWAGKELRQIGGEIKTALRFLILEQFAVIIPLALISYFLLKSPLQWIGLMLCIYAFIGNLAYFFTITAQAARQFRLLTVLTAGRGFVCMALILLIFAAGYLEYQYVIIASLASFFLFTLAFTFRYHRYLRGKYSQGLPLISFGIKNINIGIFIYCGNIVVAIFWTLDRLLVSSFFSIERFAVYAFAMAVAQIAFVFIKAVADVFFPHLSEAAPEQRTRAFQLGKRILIFCWATFLVAYFLLAMLIESYLPQYIGSLPLIKILLGMMGFSSLILILHVNYYRLYRKQREYFLWGITALVLAVLLVLIAIKMLGTLESVATAILMSSFVWYIVNEMSLKSVTGETGTKLWKDLVIMGCYFAGFWFASLLDTWLIAQMLLYTGFLLVISLAFLRADLHDLLLLAQRIRK